MHSGDHSVADEGIVVPHAGLPGAGTDPSAVAQLEELPASAVPLALSADEPDTAATGRGHWHRRYVIELVAIDLLAATLAAGFGLSLGFVLRRYANLQGHPTSLVEFAIGLPLLWVTIVGLNRAYQRRLVGVGPTEFQLVFRAFWHLAAVVIVAAYATKALGARPVIYLALPLTLIFDLTGRYLARMRLHRQRGNGRSMSLVLAVGGAASVAEFTAMVDRDRYAGMSVVGACLPNEQAMDAKTAAILDDLGVRVLGDVDSVLAAVQASRAHTVAVLSGEISAEKLRWVSWQLEGTDTDLVVSPGLTEVAGTRLHIQPVAGLPLLHVEEPDFGGFERFLKGAFDRTVAAVTLVVLAPLLAGVALAVRFQSRGPALFRQVRVGRHGHAFTMIKFRSTYADAATGEDGTRVTPIGRVLRRYSVDELPQLINVVRGQMSLVGPHSPLPIEVAAYEADVHRRLLVKPGMTGMWQIRGRNDLPWAEAVRLDLRYVENWSFALDLMILWKTIFAARRRSGAY
jgi:exopolysaccharide biosynthesis polyprenyl glycosylphosphotransferase